MPPAQLAAPARTRGCCSPVAVALEAGMADQLAALFRALADPTRVQILHMLKAASEPVCVCDLTAVFELSQPTICDRQTKRDPPQGGNDRVKGDHLDPLDARYGAR
jgi:hypothetical protein